ncbi:MAG: hypothetical protein H5T86_12540 [Armatimonadetes bacterium]|nr:hypothetical protein [Armatimonadota bacterium]
MAFQSRASNLVPGDTNGEADIFVHDRLTGRTERVSVSSTGQQGDEFSCQPSISAEGRFVAFRSFASNLVPGDANGVQDIFVHDRLGGSTERVSVSSTGRQGRNTSLQPSISADGRFVAFESYDVGLAPSGFSAPLQVFVHDRAPWLGVAGGAPYMGAAPSTSPLTISRPASLLARSLLPLLRPTL